jgi:hypothetical protein
MVLHDPKQKQEPRGVTNLGLVVAVDVRGRPSPLLPAKIDIRVNEHALSWDECVVERDKRVGRIAIVQLTARVRW